MTRFKEQRRIDNAIKHKDQIELDWALNYCKSRLATSTLKTHAKRWQKQIRDIEAELSYTEHK